MNRLRETREDKGLNQPQFAKRIGVSKQLVCDIENGRCYPSYRILRRIEEVLKCDHRDIFDDPQTTKAAQTDGQTHKVK